MSKKKRARTKLDEGGGSYFLKPSSNLVFIHTGATPLDCIIGGGWPLGRISNVIGDKSTGKTLLAIEAMANFVRQFPDDEPRYVEGEAAFDEGYAEALGLPIKNVSMEYGIETVESLFDDLSDYLKRVRKNRGLYILDSLDSISDTAEMARDMDKGTFGAAKAKQMSQLFRRIVRTIEESKTHLMIISQVRSKIGATFGRQWDRSGGRALDFYASQVIYLAHLGEITQTVNKVKRTVGVKIKTKCTKNKIGLPFRTCEFPILFGYGIEDITASIDWLSENRQLKSAGLTNAEAKTLRDKSIHVNLGDDTNDIRKELSEAVQKSWVEVERSFLPKRRKYQ